MKVYYDQDADLSVLKDETVVIIGYGNQGRPHALNMRDSGVDVIVGNVRDSYYEQAVKDGFKVLPIPEAVKQGTIIDLILPDEVQKEVYENGVGDALSKGKMLVFASGYSVQFGLVVPPKDVDVVDMYPLGIGTTIRDKYVRKEPLNAYMAIGQDATGKAKQRALALCKAVGTTTGGVIETTFENEIVINLFLEQTLYPAFYRILALVYETMVEAGYPAELVSMEMYLTKELSDLFELAVDIGLFKQLKFHSTTSQYGTLTHANKIIPDSMKETMRQTLREIQDGTFARDWTKEQAAGYPTLIKLRQAWLNHPLNETEEKAKTDLHLQ